jgi:hypothetical protein
LQQKTLRCAALALTFWLGSLGNLGSTHSAGADARAHCANARLAAQHYYNKEQNANERPGQNAPRGDRTKTGSSLVALGHLGNLGHPFSIALNSST